MQHLTIHPREKGISAIFNQGTLEKNEFSPGTLDKKSINATFNQDTLVKKVPMSHLTKEPWKKGSMLHLPMAS